LLGLLQRRVLQVDLHLLCPRKDRIPIVIGLDLAHCHLIIGAFPHLDAVDVLEEVLVAGLLGGACEPVGGRGPSLLPRRRSHHRHVLQRRNVVTLELLVLGSSRNLHSIVPGTLVFLLDTPIE